MTESLPPPETKSKRCWKKKLICFLVFLTLVVAGAVAISFCPWFIRVHGAGGTEDVVQLQQRVTTLESQVRELTQEVSDLSNHTTAAPSAPDTALSTSTVSGADLTHMQNDMVTMSSALSALQAEVKQTGNHAAATAQATQASLAVAIAFIQLRATADAGQSFTSELSAMRDASKGDAVFQEQLGKLDTIAKKGAPTVATLRDELLNLEPDAALAIDKANAGNWRQRLLAELKSLVSIRKQHGGGETDVFTAMEGDLAKGDVAATLNDMQSLPPDAQQVLAEWRAKAEARQTVDTALHDMAAHFTALAAPAQGEP